MSIQISIQKWGNSAAIRLPSAVLAQLDLRPGDKLTAEIRDGGLVLAPSRKHYTLDELLAQCDAAAEVGEWEGWTDMPPAGDEAW